MYFFLIIQTLKLKSKKYGNKKSKLIRIESWNNWQVKLINNDKYIFCNKISFKFDIFLWNWKAGLFTKIFEAIN